MTTIHQRGAICAVLLTESTRRREVFPAFCKPIMVTSISVALHRISITNPQGMAAMCCR